MQKNIFIRYVEIINKIVDFVTFNITRWVALLLVIVVIYDVFSRYLFSSPTVWGYDTVCILGLVIYCLGFSYVQKQDAHVRIDVFYEKMTDRQKAIVDTIGDILVGIPVCLVYTNIAFNYAKRAFESGEVLQSSFWYPPAGPVRTIYFIGMLLFLLTIISRLIQSLFLIFRGEKI